jgi:hypothetical protein
MAARDRELEPVAPGVLLELRGRVQDVAHEDDLALGVAELSSHHGPAVQPAAGARHGAERGAIARGAARDLVPNPEEAVRAVGVAQAALLPPGHDHLVARVPVDLAVSTSGSLSSSTTRRSSS